MSKIITVILFLFVTTVNAQILKDNIAIYDDVPQEVNSRNSFQREKWFYEQRIFPYDRLPNDAYNIAITQKMNLLNSSGLYDNTNEWLSIGPTPAVNTYYSNVSSRVVSVKFHPTNPAIIYIAAAYGGVWKTTNSGLNWYPKTDFEVTLSSGALAIDNTDPEVIYYGTGEATYFTYSYAGSGLLKSTNGGDNWTHITNGLPASTYFSRLVINPHNRNVLFAALGNSGLYKSTNSGISWAQSITGRCDDVIFSPDGSKVYCIGQGSGYKISLDSGNTFIPYNPFVLGTRNHIAICVSLPNILYAVTYQGTAAAVYKSTNGGIDYTLLQNNFTGANQGWYDLYIHVNPDNPNIAYLGLIDLWRTTNGSTFTRITNTSAGPVHVDHHNLDFAPINPSNIICANDGGVWQSSNAGNNWTNLNATLNLTQFYRITSDPSNASHLIGGTQDNGIQQTTGSPMWSVLIFGGDGGDACFQSVNTNYILAENQFNRIKRSTDSGLTWAIDTTGLSGRAAWIAPIISHPDSVGIFYTAREQVFKSTDNGDSWFPYSTGTAGIISQLSNSISDPLVMYAASNNYAFISTNGGITFNNITSNLPLRIITSFYIHPDSSNTALVSLSGFGTGHIYKTTNYGNYWFDISGNLPDIPVNDVMFYHPGYSTGILLAATDVGVFISQDYGNSWGELASSLPNTVSIHLDYNAAQNKLRVATHGRGIWEYNGNIIPIIQIQTGIPKEFSLLQNYPNPFNPSTKIKFMIPPSSSVAQTFVRPIGLSVYDILGREVTTLVNQKLAPGTYEIEWNASNFPSGIYFYKLTTGDFSESKKMMLVK
ncbi:MAG: T9SS type A sorting domain-containing protein [Ignavibacteria bacterium]